MRYNIPPADTDSFAISSVGVLTADSIAGPYTFASQCFKPDGFGSYDMVCFPTVLVLKEPFLGA